MYPIDKDVPLPTNLHSLGLKAYPWEQMEVGDSVFVPNDRSAKPRVHAVRATEKYRPRVFRTSYEGEGTRIWRVQ